MARQQYNAGAEDIRTSEWIAWEQRLTGVFTITTDWERHLADPPAPLPSSPLVGDDKAWPMLPGSLVAWMGLASAIDHLAACRRLMEASRAMMPSPYMSLARPALMGGAQTLWVLLPGRREERVRRQLLVAHEEFMESRHLAREALEQPLRSRLPADAVRSAQRQLDEATERQTETAAELNRRGHKVAKVNMTNVVKEAAEHVHADEAWAYQAVRSSWRIASGDAHGKLWPMLHRATRLPSDGSGYRLLRDGPNIEQVGMVIGAAFQVTQAALSLFQERCTPPYGGPG